jgi:fibronectin type 3 domain-containing protein
MIMKKILYSVIILLAFGSENSFAQKKTSITAFNGLKGNYVYNLFKPASPEHPDRDSVASFRFERKLANETNWQLLQDFHTPSTFEELQKNYAQSKKMVFDNRETENYQIEEIWPIYNKTFSYDSLQIYLSQQAVAAAFGILLIDTAIRPGQTYQYRITQVKTDGHTRGQYITNAVNSNDRYLAEKPVFKARKITGSLITLKWTSKVGQTPQALLVKRNNGPHKKFEQKQLPYTIEERADSLVFTIADDDVTIDELYQYTITPVNRFGGGAFVVSDTASAAILDQNLLIPQVFNAHADSAKQRIVLNWGFFKPEYISVVKVFRSIDYEGNYLFVGTGTNNQFVDETAVLGQKYYYYLTITDKLGRESLKSIKVYGLVQSLKVPNAPQNVTAIAANNQITVSWKDLSFDTRGFYVYRNDQYGGKMLLISDFITADIKKGGNYSFVDTAKLTGKVGYAVVAENLSNKRSEFSNLFYLKGGAVVAQAPVVFDQLIDGNNHRIFWQSPTGENQPAGYNVYRKINEGNYIMITRNPIRADKTTFTDTTNLSGSIKYKVVSINAAAEEGGSSNEITFADRMDIFSPSSLKTFYSEDHAAVVLEWQTSQGKVKKYEIYRYIRGAEPARVGEVTGKAHTYKDSSFVKDKTNYYYVVAVDENGRKSAPSTESFKMAINKN